MSLAVSPPRDQRRRLFAFWTRPQTSPAPAAPSAGPRRRVDYAPEAQPGRQPALATLVPTGLAGLSVAATTVLAAVAASVGVAAWEGAGGSPLLTGGGRFARTLASLRACLDLGTLESLGGWVAETCLVAACGGALVVRSMRRHRRDGVKGRAAAWGSLAGLYAIAAAAGSLPLGRLVAAFASDVTGLEVGSDGMGWWVLGAAIAFTATGFWAVLPLHERVATGGWLSASLAAWAIAAAALVVPDSGPTEQGRNVAANAAWIAGSGMAAIAMLAAARSVVREIRGLPYVRDARPAAAGGPPHAVTAGPAPAAPHRREPAHGAAADAEPRTDRIGFVNGSEGEDDEADPADRHRSKAERKRLRKLARLSRAA